MAQREENRVLLIEDTDIIRAIKETQLTGKGLKVTAVRNGREALEKLIPGDPKTPALLPEVIVTDLDQREFNGYDLTHFLRLRFKVELLTSTPELARLFGSRIDIARKFLERESYYAVRGKRTFLKDTPLIHTCSGDYRDQVRSLPSSTEAGYYVEALNAADNFVEVSPVYEENRIVGLNNIDNLHREILVQIERIRRQEST